MCVCVYMYVCLFIGNVCLCVLVILSGNVDVCV